MKSILALAALSAGLMATPALAQQSPVKLGVLDCTIDGGTAYIVGSNKALQCAYRPYDNGPEQRYYGNIAKLGVDLGQTNGGHLQWAVLALGHSVSDGALSGRYYGVNAEASVITGGGANLMVGGIGTAFTLQPLSGQVQTGLNLAVALSGMELVYSYK